MGIFDFFSNKPTPSKIAKISSRMMNEHQQQQVRQESMEELVAFGTPEAIQALVKRLGVNFRDTIKNEQEKRWIADVLVEHFGVDAIAPMCEYIRTEANFSSVIYTLRRLMEEERLVGFVVEVLQQYSPDDHRTIGQRVQLVDALVDYEGPAIIGAIMPYLMDHDDDIRIKVMDYLDGRIRKGDETYTDLLDGLVKVIRDPHAGGRITRRSASILQKLDADLSKRASELDGFVPDGYQLGTNGRMTATS